MKRILSVIYTMFESEVACDLLHKECVEFFKKCNKKNIFYSHNMLHEIDMKGGVLSHIDI